MSSYSNALFINALIVSSTRRRSFRRPFAGLRPTPSSVADQVSIVAALTSACVRTVRSAFKEVDERVDVAIQIRQIRLAHLVGFHLQVFEAAYQILLKRGESLLPVLGGKRKPFSLMTMCGVAVLGPVDRGVFVTNGFPPHRCESV